MKRGFTLVELLVVVAVIAILMGIVFRLAGTGDDTKARNITIMRMQKLEFALSGYYAAFGSYPPVPLQGRSRDVYRRVNENGVQYTKAEDRITLPKLGEDMSGEKFGEAIASVRAACMAQPVAAEFPLNEDRYKDYFKATGGGSDSYGVINKSLKNINTESDWPKVRIFKFGLMSFLLPRYLFMMDGPNTEKNYYEGCKQWMDNNRLASIYDLEDGTPAYGSWQDLRDELKFGSNQDSEERKYQQLANSPSQIVCARWMSALEGICSVWGTPATFYGINVNCGDSFSLGKTAAYSFASPSTVASHFLLPNYQDAENGGSGFKYQQGSITVVDGWGHDLFYYSPPPHKGYRLWSAGPDGLTFPPWIDFEKFRKSNKQTAELMGQWMADDIMHLSN